jgi:hypothetical protein
MNYKNSTPFKLKGSPFKNTDPKVTKNVTTNSAGELLLQTSSTETSTSPDVVKKRLSYDDAWSQNLEGIQAMYKNKKDYINERESQKKKDPVKFEKDLVDKTGVSGGPGEVIIPGETIETTTTNTDPVMYTPTGKSQASWQQRSNIRAIKNLTGQSKRNQMRNLREGNIAASAGDYATLGTDGTEEYTDKKMISKKNTRQAIKDARKELRNPDPTADPAYAKANAQKTLDEAKGRHKKMKKIYKDKKREIKGEKRKNRQTVIDQEIRNRINQSASGNKNTYNMDPVAVTNATSSDTVDDRTKNSKKISTPFKLGGFGSKNKNK